MRVEKSCSSPAACVLDCGGHDAAFSTLQRSNLSTNFEILQGFKSPFADLVIEFSLDVGCWNLDVSTSYPGKSRLIAVNRASTTLPPGVVGGSASFATALVPLREENLRVLPCRCKAMQGYARLCKAMQDYARLCKRNAPPGGGWPFLTFHHCCFKTKLIP